MSASLYSCASCRTKHDKLKTAVHCCGHKPRRGERIGDYYVTAREAHDIRGAITAAAAALDMSEREVAQALGFRHLFNEEQTQ